MNKSKMAGALNAISVGFGELAEAIMEEAAAPVLAPLEANEESWSGGQVVPNTVVFDPPETAEPAEGSLSQCPKHHKPYLDGTYGPYCPSLSDDPAWSNRKGYCRITPKNAAAWLRIQAA